MTDVSMLAGLWEGNADTWVVQLTTKASYCGSSLVVFSSFRNGISLGTAFDNITRGAGMAYFPAISLSFKESVAFNFGSRPLRYPLGVGRGCLKGDEPVLRPPFEAIEYMYLSAVHFFLVLLLRAESRREAAISQCTTARHAVTSSGASNC